MNFRYFHFRASVLPILVSQLASAEMPEKIEYLLEDHCWKCHDYGTQKGDIRLDNLSDLETPKLLDLLNRMQEQVYFKHMPPKKEDQPTEEERKTLLSFLSDELAVHNASTLEGKLQKPEFGNYVDHEKLFSGEYADLPGFTRDRRWLINPLFPRLRSGHRLFQRPSRQKQIPSNQNHEKPAGRPQPSAGLRKCWTPFFHCCLN